MDYEAMGVITFDKVASGNIYLYGSTIRFEGEQVILTNVQLPPSRPIFSWQSRYNYQGDRRSPELPLLIPEKNYRLDLEIESLPAHCFFVKITFFNRQEDIVDTYIQRELSASFTCPEEAFSYQLQIFGAGCENIAFTKMTFYQEVLEQTIQLDEELMTRTYQEVPADLDLVKPLLIAEDRKEEQDGKD